MTGIVAAETCWERTGSSNSRNQQRPRCSRPAKVKVLWDGEWRPVCNQHLRFYPGLPVVAL